MTTNRNTTQNLKAPAQQTPVEYDETTLELMRIVAATQLDFVHAPVNYDELQKPMTIVTARNGVFQVHKTPVAIFVHCKTAFKPEEELVHLPPMKEEIIRIADKIPFRYLIQILSFYRDVHKKDKTEAATLIFWNDRDVEIPTHYPDDPTKPVKGLTQDGKLIIYCPEQINTSGDTNFKNDTFVSWLRQNTARYVELHSHHTMDAFWSGTDNQNENATQFYFVWGKIFDNQPVYKFRYVNGKDRKIDIDADLIFDFPKVEVKTQYREIKNTTSYDPEGIIGNLIATESDEITHTTTETILFQGPFQDMAYPADWMDQHEVERSSFRSRQGSMFNGGRSNYDPYYGYDDDYGHLYGDPDAKAEALLRMELERRERQYSFKNKGGSTSSKKDDSAQVAHLNNLDQTDIELITLEESEMLLDSITSVEVYNDAQHDYTMTPDRLDNNVEMTGAARVMLYVTAILKTLQDEGALSLILDHHGLTPEEYQARISEL